MCLMLWMEGGGIKFRALSISKWIAELGFPVEGLQSFAGSWVRDVFQQQQAATATATSKQQQQAIKKFFRAWWLKTSIKVAQNDRSANALHLK